jgi:hypothetical protein
MNSEKDSLGNFFKKVGSYARDISDGFKKMGEISSDDVYENLDKIQIKKHQYTSEKNVESVIAKQLEVLYKDQIHTQYGIGGFLHLKIDIDIADGQVGIELKLCSEMNSSNIERLLGQVLYYSKRKYKSNLIVVVVGTEKEYDQTIRELKSIIEEQGVKFFYMKVQ